MALVDDRYPYFIAGSVDAESGEDGDCTSDSPTCLGRDDAELQQWRAIIEQTIAEDSCSSTQTELTSIIPSPSEDDRSANLSSVCGDPHLSFYAAAPLAPKKGIHLGAVFVVDTTARKTLTAPQQALLRATAQKCMQQLESGRDGVNKERWERVNEQLGIFLGSRAIREQQLEEPPALANDDQQKRRTGEIEEVKEIARAHGRDPSKAEQQPGIPEDIFNDKQESSRVTKAETERDERIASEEEERNPRTFTAEVDDNRSRNSENPGESTYYKIFRRAAECLVEALQVDGVLFTNGLIGHHGAVQAVGELEEDLRQEMVKRPHRAKGGLVSPEPPKDGSGDDTSRQLRKDDSGEKRNGEKSTTTRTYTSPEYWRGIYVDQPAEIIGYSSRNPNVAPKTKQIKETTRGLAFLTEGQLQVLMDRYPKGSVWYIPDADGVCYRLNSGTLTEDSMEETQRLRRSLSNVRQMIFLPLTDPVTLKRLAGCFAYSTRTFPVFTDTMDVPALRGFLHVLEAEISRFDAATAVKQKESFVSSVSHELRKSSYHATLVVPHTHAHRNPHPRHPRLRPTPRRHLARPLPKSPRRHDQDIRNRPQRHPHQRPLVRQNQPVRTAAE